MTVLVGEYEWAGARVMARAMMAETMQILDPNLRAQMWTFGYSLHC